MKFGLGYGFMGVNECRIIDLPTYEDERGALSVLEQGDTVPFDISRAFYIYDVPAGASRGEHAHRRTEQFFIAVAGDVDIRLDDGQLEEEHHLSDATTGLYVPAGIWGTMSDFSDDAILLVLASEPYDEDEYIRDYGEYLDWREAR